MSAQRKVVEKRWGLCFPGRSPVVVGPKGYRKYAAEQDAKIQRAIVVRVTISYPLPPRSGNR